MRQLPLRARYYISLCYLLGAGAAAWLVTAWPWPVQISDLLLTLGLCVVAAACQTFVVKRAGTSHSDHLTQAALCAALVLLPSPLLAATIIVAFVPEWYIYRRRWFIQTFNIAAYLFAAAAGRLALDMTLHSWQRWASWSLGALVFLLLQTVLLALVLKLARGESMRQNELFSARKLLVEVTLLAVGMAFAICWEVTPAFGLIAALPLALIFEALHVPNLKHEAATDPKTGLANMRHFNAVMARELERAERGHQQMSLLMCDLDYLRNINNTYGHQAGDLVLVSIAQIIQRQIRGTDVAARFGGEEFVVLLTDRNSEQAHIVAERLRSELESVTFEVGHSSGPIRATISIGIATFPGHGRTIETLMHEADLAVYQAKREGRNRTAIAGRTSRSLAGDWAREHLVTAPVIPPAPEKQTARWLFVSEATRDHINEETAPVITVGPGAPRRQEQPTRGQRQARRRHDTPLRVYLVIACIVSVGLLGLLPGLLTVGPHLHAWLWPLTLFAGLTIIAEYFAFDMSAGGKTSVALVSVLAATFLFGPIGIFVTALALAASIGVKARSPLYRVWFNFGAVLLSAEAAAAAFSLMGRAPVSAAGFAFLIVPALAGGLLYYGVNHLLLCTIRGLHERRSPWQLWQAEYRWLWPHFTVLGGLALVIAVGYQVLGALGVLALAAPVVMMHVAIKQYRDKTGVHVEELERLNDRLTESYEATLQALMSALDSRDEETEAHSQRVKNYSALMAGEIGVPAAERDHIIRGALLHDIGKIGVPDAILLKPGRLTDDERSIMRKHPEIGYAMIAHIPFLAQAAHVVLHHHESYDGTGYPSGLSGSAIPLGARIFAVADAFDAMTSDRPYRRALTIEAAFAEIERCSGSQFDPQVVAAFRSIPLADLEAVYPDFRRALADPVLDTGVFAALAA